MARTARDHRGGGGVSLKFNDRAHRYWIDGKPAPGVTSILSKGLPKPALVYWSARTVAEHVAADPGAVVEMVERMGERATVAALKEIPWQKRDDAAVRGTDVHAIAEEVIHGRAVEVPAHLVDHVDGYVRFLDAFDVQPLHTEVPVGSRSGWYAGKFDAIATFGRGKYAGRTALLDWKTSSGIYGETALQTAAYACAEFMAPEPDDERPLPALDLTGVVHITADGSRLHVLGDGREPIDRAYQMFRHIAWTAARLDWLKGLVGDPIPEPETADV